MMPHDPPRQGAQRVGDAPGLPDDDAAPALRDDADELVHRAVRAAPMPPVPAGFAAAVARLVADDQEQARTETLLTLACAAAILVAAAVFALPGLGAALVSIVSTHDEVPWPMLAAATATLLLVAGADGALRASQNRRGR